MTWRAPCLDDRVGVRDCLKKSNVGKKKKKESEELR